MDNKNQEFLGVDVGAARVGFARGSSLAKLAQALKTVPASQAVAELSRLVKDNKAAGVVVGLPRSLDGSETAQTTAVRSWALAAAREIKADFYWQDEALTSREAAGRIQSSKLKAQTVDEDALAAAIILQDFLDTPESDRLAL